MSAIQIVCQNCGAKYKIPESFTGDKAKCKQCAAVIDVAAQRDAGGTAPAGAKPAAAKPASAKPASARRAGAKAEPRRASAGRRAGAEASEGEKPRRAGSRRARAGASGDDDGGGEGRRGGRRRRDEPEKKKGVSPALIGGILVVVAVAVVGAILAFGGNGDEGTGDATDQTAQAAGAANEQANADAEAAAKEAAAKEAADKEAAEKAAADAAAKEAAEKAAEDAAAKEAAAAKEPPPTEITSREDVFDPKTLPVLEYPEGTSDELKEEVQQLVQDVFDGGLQGARAKTRLEEIGYPAVFGIINRLRTIDYFDSSESMTAYELNRLLEAMAVGINVGYRPPVIGEEQKLEDVDWNAKTAKAWHRLPVLYPNAERFDELKKKRETRHMGR